jgi:hypothetical protein
MNLKTIMKIMILMQIMTTMQMVKKSTNVPNQHPLAPACSACLGLSAA